MAVDLEAGARSRRAPGAGRRQRVPGTGFGAEGETFGEAVFNTGMAGLPGGADRSVLRGPDRGDDLAASGQLRDERGRSRVGRGCRSPGSRCGRRHAARRRGDRKAPWVTSLLAEASRRSKASTRGGSRGSCAIVASMRAAISTVDLDPGSLVERVQASPGMAGADLARTVSADEPYEAAALVGPGQHRPRPGVPGGGLRLRDQAQHPAAAGGGGHRDHGVPGADAGGGDRGRRFDGVFLSNGPGDPVGDRLRHRGDPRPARDRCRSSGSAWATSCSPMPWAAAPTR